MVLRSFGRAVCSLGALLLVVTPASTQEPEIPLLARLEAGRWELRGASNISIASICLGERHLLIQPQHGSAACARSLVSSDATSVTVRYTCPGNGFGQSTIRLETTRLVQIESQGVHKGVPFSLRGEARRIAPCR